MSRRHGEMVAATSQNWPVWVSRFLAADPWARAIVPVASVAPLVNAGAVAITGREASALVALAGGLPGILIVAWLGHRGGWDLNRSQRATVWDTNRSGRSSGDPHLDAIVAYQLEQADRSETAGKVFMSAMIVTAAAAPVAAGCAPAACGGCSLYSRRWR